MKIFFFEWENSIRLHKPIVKKIFYIMRGKVIESPEPIGAEHVFAARYRG